MGGNPYERRFSLQISQSAAARIRGGPLPKDFKTDENHFSNPVIAHRRLAFSMVMLMGTAFYFSPTTRALADSIIRQFGVFTFVQATPETKPIQSDTNGQPVPGSLEKKDPLQDQAEQSKKQSQANENVMVSYAQDAAAASQLAGFTVLAPAYLPDGYRVENTSGEWAVFYKINQVRTSISYESQDGSSFLTIEQIEHQPGQSKTVESAEIVDVTVRGQSGYGCRMIPGRV